MFSIYNSLKQEYITVYMGYGIECGPLFLCLSSW